MLHNAIDDGRGVGGLLLYMDHLKRYLHYEEALGKGGVPFWLVLSVTIRYK